MTMNDDAMAKLAKPFQASYNSDEDLPDDTQAKIKQLQDNNQFNAASSVRKDAWDSAGPWPKLKKLVKTRWDGDTQGDN